MSRVALCVQNLGVPDDPRVWGEAVSLRSAGHEVTVIAPRTNGAACRERIDDIEVVRYRGVGGDGLLGQLVEIATGFIGTVACVLASARRGRFDVVHVANPPDTLFPLAWWLRRRGTRFIYDQHDAAPELAAAKLGRNAIVDRVLRILERATLRASDLVIVSNNSARRRAIRDRSVDPRRVLTVRFGPATVAAPVAPPDIPTVVYAGVMGTQDTVDVLVDAFALVLRRRPGGARLVLVGHGDAVPDLRRRVDGLGIAEAVTWTGWLPRKDVRAHLVGATVGVSPDVDNDYTRLCTMVKVAEYLTAGVPVVVADLPENRATAGRAGTYFRPGDVSDLAAKLEELLFDPARRSAMAAEAARRGPQLLWSRSETRLLAAYKHLLGGAPAVDGDQHVDDDMTEGH